jgi:putative solute:sodium symporter small subunit
MENGSADRYWSRTSALMWTMFALWVFFSFIIHFFVNQLNSIVILGFPLGFYMAAQGSLIAFVVMLFIFAKRQDAIDREEGVAEDR